MKQIGPGDLVAQHVPCYVEDIYVVTHTLSNDVASSMQVRIVLPGNRNSPRDASSFSAKRGLLAKRDEAASGTTESVLFAEE